MRVDAHQQFWDLRRFQYFWMPPEPSPLHRTFLPDHLASILYRNRFDGSIVVQANTLLDETRWLLGLAVAHDFIVGVVGWVDLTDTRVGEQLDELQRNPKFKGVRHPVQDEPDPRCLLRDDVVHGLKEVARRGLPYDLLVHPNHLPLIPLLAERVPELRLVIDHLAKPRVGAREIEPWARDIATAAALPQVCCKLSGLITQANSPSAPAAELKPYVEHVYRLFGPDRLMFGSDWPVCLPAGTWKAALAACTQALGPLPMEARSKLLGDTAVRFYGLG